MIKVKIRMGINYQKYGYKRDETITHTAKFSDDFEKGLE